MQVAVFHPGTQHSRQTALALQWLGRLAFLATSLFDSPQRRRWPGAPGRALDRAMAAYAFPALDPALVRTHGTAEWLERAAARAGLGRLACHLDRIGNARFAAWVADEAAGAGAPLALWGYDGVAGRAFADPRLADRPKILDRTIADWRAWNAERAAIAQTHGDWLAGSSPAASAAQIARDEAEYAAATHIVCGSPFALETIRRHAAGPGIADKLCLLPYPHDAALFAAAPEPPPSRASAPLRFLFLGEVSARKGIHHVLEAFARLPRGAAQLTVAGPRRVAGRLLAPYRELADFIGPVGRHEVPALMRRHEVLVLPSHFEGSAVTLLEALASGLAIVQSRQAGLGASADSGIVLDRPGGEALEEAMAALIADRARVDAMRRAALAEAGSYSFARYTEGVAALLGRLEA